MTIADAGSAGQGPAVGAAPGGAGAGDGVPPAAPAGGATTPPASSERYTYGLIAVAMGLLALLICFVVAVNAYSKSSDATAVIGSVAGTIGAIVGAYFGIQVGSSGTAAAQANATQAQKALSTEKDKVQVLSTALTPEQGLDLLKPFIKQLQ